jgi:MFS family permease
MKPEAVQAAISAEPDPNENRNGEKESRDQHRKTGSIITILGSALANLSDGYQQSLASSTNVIFSHVLGKEIYTSDRQTRISNSLLVGSVIGILIFGYVSDRLSRKGGMLLTSGLVVVGSLMSALAFQVGDARHMLWFMTIARGTAGVGVGGKPNSTSIAKRFANLSQESIRPQQQPPSRAQTSTSTQSVARSKSSSRHSWLHPAVRFAFSST